MVAAYYKMLTSSDPEAVALAARQWSLWEGRGLRLIPDAEHIASFTDPRTVVAQARIECHYMTNECFLAEDELIRNISAIQNIPCVLIHGRYDLICPVKTSWKMHKAWPQADLRIVPDAGHSAREPGIQQQIISSTNRFADIS